MKAKIPAGATFSFTIATPWGRITGRVDPFYSAWRIDLRHDRRRVLAGHDDEAQFETFQGACDQVFKRSREYLEHLATTPRL